MQIWRCVCSVRPYEYSGVAGYDVIYMLNCLELANINKRIARKAATVFEFYALAENSLLVLLKRAENTLEVQNVKRIFFFLGSI